MDSQTSDYQKLIQILQSDRNSVDLRPSLRKSALIDLIIIALEGIEQGTFSNEIETLIPNEFDVQTITPRIIDGVTQTARGRGQSASTGQIRGGIVRATSFQPTSGQPLAAGLGGQPSLTSIPFQRGNGPQVGAFRGGMNPRGGSPAGTPRASATLLPLKLQGLGSPGQNSPRYTQNLSQNNTPRQDIPPTATPPPEEATPGYPEPQIISASPLEGTPDSPFDAQYTSLGLDLNNHNPHSHIAVHAHEPDDPSTTGEETSSNDPVPAPPSILSDVNPFMTESDSLQDALREELYGSNNLYQTTEDDSDLMDVGELTVDLPGLPQLSTNSEAGWTTARKGGLGSSSPNFRTKLGRSASEAPPRPQPAAPEDLKKLYEKRNAIINELMATEQTYLCNLIILNDVFIKPLHELNLIPEQTFQLIFQPQIIFQITAIAGQFCFALSEESALRRDLTMIGHPFCSFAQKFKIYGKFINAYEASCATFASTMKKNPEFAKFIRTSQREKKCQGHTLEDFLISVVQRLPRYVLLLSDIAKETPRMHPDYNDTTTALEQMKSVAEYVNNEKRRYESWIKAKSLHIEFALQADWHAQKFFGCEYEIFKNPPAPAGGATPRVETKRKNYKIIVFNDSIWMISTLKDKTKEATPTVLKLGLKQLEKVDGLSFKLGARTYYATSEAIVTKIFETQARFTTGPENIKLLYNKKDRTKSTINDVLDRIIISLDS